jgi:hypothetical protein
MRTRTLWPRRAAPAPPRRAGARKGYSSALALASVAVEANLNATLSSRVVGQPSTGTGAPEPAAAVPDRPPATLKGVTVLALDRSSRKSLLPLLKDSAARRGAGPPAPSRPYEAARETVYPDTRPAAEAAAPPAV